MAMDPAILTALMAAPGLAQLQGTGQQMTGMWGQAAPSISQGMWGPTGYDPASAVQAGQQVQGSAAGLPGYAQQALQTGFDPQNALYARTAQQLQDQTRSGLAARGLSMDPYGAGVEGQTMSNFNLDWLDRLLGREQQGAQTAQGLLGQYGQQMAGGQALQQSGPGFQSSLLGSLEGAGATSTQPANQYVQGALGIGGMEQQYQNQNRQPSPWGALGSLAGGATQMFSGAAKPWIFA
jgi:hypothetical protein